MWKLSCLAAQLLAFLERFFSVEISMQEGIKFTCLTKDEVPSTKVLLQMFQILKIICLVEYFFL